MLILFYLTFLDKYRLSIKQIDTYALGLHRLLVDFM